VEEPKINNQNGTISYRQELGLLESVSIVIGKIIGSGIFRTPGPIMALTMCTSLFGLVWLIGGAVALLGAMCYAELVSMMPKSGGPYVYLKEAYHPIWAFLRGWAMFFVSETAAISAVALVFSEYLSALMGLIFNTVIPKYMVIIIALAAIWVLTAINCFGIHLSGIVQNVFSFLKIIAIGSIIGVSFVSGGRVSHFTDSFWPASFGWETLFAFGAALRYSFFAFSGWEGASYLADEVKNPDRNLPLSMLLGICGVLLLYFGANAAYIYQLPVDAVKSSKWVATDAMKAAIGGAGGILISFAVMLNTFGNVGTQILTKARGWQVMAADGLFFGILAPISKRYNTPNNSLIGQAIWASVLLVFAGIAKNSYEAIIDFFAANGAIFNIMTFYSIYILRKKYPDLPRPYRAWLYPYSMILIIAVYALYLVVTLITALEYSIIGILLTSSGLVYYYFKIRKKPSSA
jgi:amino acid transporter